MAGYEPLLGAPSQAGAHGGIVLTLVVVIAVIALVAALVRAGRSRDRSAEQSDREGPEA